MKTKRNRSFKFGFSLCLLLGFLVLTFVFAVRGNDFYSLTLSPLYLMFSIMQTRSTLVCYAELQLEKRFGSLVVDEIENYGKLKREKRGK